MNKNISPVQNYIKVKGGVSLIGILDKVSLFLTILGSLNWGCVGLFSFNVVDYLLGGPQSLLSRAVYVVIAASGIWCITLLFKDYPETGRN